MVYPIAETPLFVDFSAKNTDFSKKAPELNISKKKVLTYYHSGIIIKVRYTKTRTESGRLPGRKKDKMDKKLQQQYQAYLRSEKYDIYDAYRMPSIAKREAWSRCLDMCKRDGGYDIKIIRKNTFAFSVGYLSRVGGYTTFTYITRDNIRTATV